MSITILITLILAYLIGAIPTSVWFGKIFYKKDVRQYGSGNAGATNTFRVFGAVSGIIVLAIDILKGVVAVMLSHIFSLPEMSKENLLFYQLSLGLIAAIGHIFPVYLNFKGGKGVATFFGVVLYLFPVAALICTITFFIVFGITHYVSVGSILASLAFMLTLFFYYAGTHVLPVLVFSIAVPVIIIFTHRKNIQRLLSGSENKFHLTRKEKTT